MKPEGSFASPDFWDSYAKLPHEMQDAADKQFELFSEDLAHPSLRLKPIGNIWSVRVCRGYRALAVRKGNTFFWFWIGSHDEYERLVG